MASLGEILNRKEPLEFKSGTFSFPGGELKNEVQEMLGDLQGNILTWHNRTSAHYFFINFKSGPEDLLKAKYLLGMAAEGIESANRNLFRRKIQLELWQRRDLKESEKQALLVQLERGPMEDEPLIVSKENYPYLKALRITSELQLRKTVEENKGNKDSYRKDDFFLSVLLSYRGYGKLGSGHVPPDSLPFREGMARREGLGFLKRDKWSLGAPLNRKLGDPTLAPEDAFVRESARQTDMDALLILACNPGSLNYQATIDAFRDTLREFSDLLHEEIGVAIAGNAAKKSEKERPWYIEPFGFRDGISQPLFYRTDIESQAAASFGNPEGNFKPLADPSAPLGLVLVPDPNGGPYSCGSFFAYRKLKQDIAGFYRTVEQLCERTGSSRDQILAMMMGRKTDGTPLVPPSAGKVGPAFNDFDYSDDAFGSKCPFHAHMRKVGPRADFDSDPREHRIARRGMSFGPKLKRESDNTPTLDGSGNPIPLSNQPGDVGMHFMCAQSDLERQFEHVQKQWANNEFNDYLSKRPGPDPIGGLAQDGKFKNLHFRVDKGELTAEYAQSFDAFVEFLGGEYFFAPSISFFKKLAL